VQFSESKVSVLVLEVILSIKTQPIDLWDQSNKPR
jgi:hypothetical protein